MLLKAQEAIELYAVGYDDFEIRKRMGLNVTEYVEIWTYIKTEQLIYTENIAYFEKALLRIDANIRRSLGVFKEAVGENTKVALVRHLADLEMKRIDILQKFGHISPDSIIFEHRIKDREVLAGMTTEQLTAYYNNQFNKPLKAIS
jgi:hypothetical protein